MRETAKLLGLILICQATGVLGALFTVPSIPTWYAGLNKPWFNPPNWLFGPVWTTLYLLMAIAAYLVWRQGIERPTVRRALKLFAIQLGLNAIWSPMFFGLHDVFLGLVVILLLLGLLAWTHSAFKKVSPMAAALLVPYVLWVGFASLLNSALYLLN
ncbi:MAG: TspO/MBR family protein [Candidatus Alcyoniella australis]|nr:TspO/MBR family protein [Candidatus Alcyoniella australis]